MGRLQLGFEASLDDWTIHGSPADCVETIERARARGARRASASRSTACRRDVRARIEYLQMIAERIVAPVSDARRA